MNPYAIMDVETTRLRHGEFPRTKFWGFYDGQTYRDFNKTKHISKYLRQAASTNLLHHFNFDMMILMLDGETPRISKSHNGRLITGQFHEHQTINSGSVFPISLKQVFEAFGYEKKPLECKKHQPRKSDSEKEAIQRGIDSDNCAKCSEILHERNYDDCVLGLECFLKLDALFLDLVGISPLVKHTIASTGFAAAEKIAGKMPKDLRFLPAYRGGRVEVFDTREIKARMYDINSSYPRSFIECPASLELWRVKVTTKDWHCPFFDANNHDTLLFPNGTFTTWMFRENYEKYIAPYAEHTAIKILSRHKIDSSWIVRLAEFVESVFLKKQDGKTSEGLRLVCKLLLNSLYGRIGLKGETERCRLLDYCPDGDDILAYAINKKWLCFDKLEREPRSNYAFAAFITDNARCRQWRAFKHNETIYGDTDSIVIRDESKFSEPIGNRLGDWSLKKKSGEPAAKMFEARNVKDYSFGSEEVLKGGHEFLSWTLKSLGENRPVNSVHRTRRTTLRKRIVFPSGETMPIILTGR